MSQTVMAHSNRNNQGISVLKALACIIVICFHYPFPGVIGDGIVYALRFPVPIFFMISGYYSVHKEAQWIRKKAGKMLLMIIGAECFYGLWSMLNYCVFSGHTLDEWIAHIPAFRHIIRTLLCGSFFCGVLWYLYAMFWTWIFLLLFGKRLKDIWKGILVVALLFFQVFGRLYWQNHFDIEKDIYLFLNALSFGIPMVLYGQLLGKYRDVILKKITLIHAFLIMFAGGVVMVAEFLVSGQYMDFHISTLIISTGLFLGAQKLSVLPMQRLFRPLAYIGEKYSMWIYLAHMFCGSVIEKIVVGLDAKLLSTLWHWAAPFFIFVMSVGISAILCMLIQKMENGKRDVCA